MPNFSRFSIETGIEELNEYRPTPSLSACVPYEDIQISQSVRPLVCYSLIDMAKTPYHFGQCFCGNESVEYFDAMRILTSSTINNLVDAENKNKLSHFYRTKLSGNLLRLIKQISPKGYDSNMFVYHFALHTDNAGANRDRGTRSPRVYFMLGEKGIIYPLFFDPFHEINPM